MNSSIFVVQFKEISYEIGREISGKKKGREREERLYSSEKLDMVGGSNKFSLHYRYAQRKASRFGKHDDRMVNSHDENIILWLEGHFFLQNFRSNY